jgi:hypothetical protein
MTIFKLIKAARSLLISGPLSQDGWVRSYLEGQSVNLNGNPIPWITYPTIDFLTQRLPRMEDVFEYGSGNGTHWWAQKSDRVRSVEHDTEWYHKMVKSLPENVELYYESLTNGSSYEEKILIDDRYYDAIIVDGRHRNACMVHSIKRIKPNGIIILDNSDRPEYKEGIDHMISNGFRKIEFSGFCPIVNFKSQTVVFYKSHNILGI